MNELPKGWVETTLGLSGAWSSGGTPSRARPDYFGAGVPWIKSGDLPDGPLTRTEEQITEEGLANSSAKLLPPGTISIALYGATIGKLGILTFAAATNQACANAIPSSGVGAKYLFYYLLSERQRLIDLGQGGAQPNISQTILKNHRLALAPQAEQDRIVTKLDALLARVNACQQRLDKIPKLLARFRQSVLAAACSGRLTCEWRTRNILASRRGADLASEGLDLCADWDVHELGKLLSGIDAGRSFTCEERPPTASEFGVLKISAVTWDRFDENESKTCHDRERWVPTFAVHKGDFLISRANTQELVGACVIVREISKKLMLSDKTLRLRFEGLDPDWALCWLRSQNGRSQIERLATGNQESMRNISQKALRSIQIPVPPDQEQVEIVRRVERFFVLADRLEARVQSARERVGDLTQSILGRAFRGELVPTEAELAEAEGRDYETASMLLERINVGREDSGSRSRPASRRKRARSTR